LRVDAPDDVYQGLSNFAEVSSEGSVLRVPLKLADSISYFQEMTGGTVVAVCLLLCVVKNNKLSVLNKTAELFAYAHTALDRNVEWGTGLGFISREEFMAGLLQQVPQYTAVCNHDQLIHNPQILYMHSAYPDATGVHLKKFIDFHSPASDADRIIFACMLAAAMWGGRSMPLFVIQADAVRGVGKTTAVINCCLLYDQSPLTLSSADRRDAERFKRRAVSSAALSLEFVLMDNISGELSSTDLADLITAKTISTTPNHGLEERQRTNNMRWLR
jgi:hypothetical protein